MTTTTDSSPESAGLQFDHAEHQGGSGAPGGPLVCSKCARPITTEYYQVGDAVACAECKAAVVREQEEAAARGRRASGLARALLFGMGAAIAGAIIYYAVIAITEWELAIIALLCGYMVGWAVRRGSRGVGGRRYQWAAILLTYLSVGMAYMPVAYKGLLEAQKKGFGPDSAKVTATAKKGVPAPAVSPTSTSTSTPMSTSTSTSTPTSTSTSTSTSTAAVATTATATPAAAAVTSPAPTATPTSAAGKRDVPRAPGGPVLWGAIALALLATLLLSLVLPLLVVIGTFPSGILSAVIIGVGMHQAWKMTAAAAVPVSGPYRLGSGAGQVSA